MTESLLYTQNNIKKAYKVHFFSSKEENNFMIGEKRKKEEY